MTDMAEGKSQVPHAAFLPSPGMGHLTPLAELAKILVLRHGFTVTFIVFSDFSDNAQMAFLDSLPAGFSHLALPSVPLDDIPAEAKIETRLSAMVARSVPSVRDVIRRLRQSTCLTAFIVDLFGGDALPVAEELGVPSYFFFTTNFQALSLLIHLPDLDRKTSCEYRDLPEPVVLPGCVPLRGEDLSLPIQERADDAYRCILNISARIREADGILVNSFADLESAAYAALKEGIPAADPLALYPVGPIVYRGRGREGKGADECLGWLDEQPPGSVLFVSFGSGGTLSREQILELALGLEASGQRFLWVLRCPSDRDVSAAFFRKHRQDDPLAFLPEGFLERTRAVGLVVPPWAPQVEVLAHRATGGFLSHCGWNSALESLVQGVPMIAWPLYAEQRMNAVLLEVGVGAALRPRVSAGGVVVREEVAEVVKELMEGEGGQRVREKMRLLKEAAARRLKRTGLRPEHSRRLLGSGRTLQCHRTECKVAQPRNVRPYEYFVLIASEMINKWIPIKLLFSLQAGQ